MSSKSRQNTVREPRQQRSKLRSDQILDAARSIIAAKGYANLTISEIAQVAEVTPGSMYQYFRNKGEIILALAKHYAELGHIMFRDVYATRPNTLQQHFERLWEVVERYYQLHLENPVIRDIWAGAATDKEMQNLAREENLRNIQFHIELAAPLFPPAAHEEMARALLVLMQYGISTAFLALDVGEEEGRKLLKTAKPMLLSSWCSFVDLHVPDNNLPELLAATR